MCTKPYRLKLLVLFFSVIPFSSAAESLTEPEIFPQTDALFSRVENQVHGLGLEKVVDIDHARLAWEAGISTMSPSRVLLFSDPKLNAELIAINPLIGLDLPFRILAYGDQGKAKLAFTNAEFLRNRYEIESRKLLIEYDLNIKNSLMGSENVASPVKSKITPGYGILSIDSDFNYEDSYQRLKQAVLAQGDTVWFAEIDYQEEAREFAIELPKVKLLLFGGPAPGGQAMSQFPLLGLDAFCQKVLLLESSDNLAPSNNKVSIHFNSIPDLAMLHYQQVAKPHEIINGRLVDTFTKALVSDKVSTDQPGEE